MIHAIFTFRNFHYWFNGNANMAYIDHYFDKQNQDPKRKPPGSRGKQNSIQKQCTRKL